MPKTVVREAASAKLKDGLPRKSFAYAPTSDPATWKLPFLTASGAPDPDHLPGAAAAVSEGGYRGQKADIPAGSVGMVKSKLRQAYRRWKGSDVEYPDSIKEVETSMRESGAATAVGVREATVLLDKTAVQATVINAPNGDMLVVPCYDGQFQSLAKPYEEYQPNNAWSASYNISDAADALRTLTRLRATEAGGDEVETDQVAMLDAAIAGIVKFMQAEATEAPESDTAEAAYDFDAFEAAIREAGKRNSGRDMKRIQAAHDLMHDLGAEHDTSTRAQYAEAQVDPAAKPEEVSFKEGSGEGAVVVTLAEADAQFDDANKQVWITPIRPGFGNAKDGFYYPEGTLREATQNGLFNGLMMFRNHPRKSDEKDLPERSVTDWFASVKESTWDEAHNRPRALVQVFEDSDWNRFKAAPEQVSFSVLGKGKARPGTVSGHDVKVVESLTKLRSVDWVTQAGAGGAIEFAESASDEEFDMGLDVEKLTVEQATALKESDPPAYAHLVGLAKALVASETETPPPTPEVTEPPKTETEEKPEAPVAEAAKPEEPAKPATISESDTQALLTELLAERAERKAGEAKTAGIAAGQAVVKAVLKETTLPTVAREAIEAKFAEVGLGNGFIYTDEPAYRGALAKEIEATGKLITTLSRGGSTRVTGLGSPATDSPDSPIREAVAKRLEGKWGTERVPKPRETTFRMTNTGVEAGTDEDKPEAAPIQEGSKPVATRLESKFG